MDLAILASIGIETVKFKKVSENKKLNSTDNHIIFGACLHNLTKAEKHCNAKTSTAHKAGGVLFYIRCHPGQE
jgi:hypothetical protein